MKKNNFMFLVSYFDAIENLEYDERLKTLYAVVKYGVTGTLPKETSKITKLALNLIKPTIDASINRYKASVENGKKGGAPKGNKNAQKQPKNNLETSQKQPRNNPQNNLKQPRNNLEKEKEKEKDIEKDTFIKENTQKKTFVSVLGLIENIDLKNCLQEFVNSRERIKKPLTPYALELAIDNLKTLSNDTNTQIAIVNQTIAQGWVNFYPLDKGNHGKQTKQEKKSALDNLTSLYNDELAKNQCTDIVIKKE